MKLPILGFLAVMLLFSVGALHSSPSGAALKLGDEAPDFELPDQNGNRVRLSSFRGSKNVVLAFYVLAFTGG